MLHPWSSVTGRLPRRVVGLVDLHAADRPLTPKRNRQSVRPRREPVWRSSATRPLAQLAQLAQRTAAAAGRGSLHARDATLVAAPGVGLARVGAGGTRASQAACGADLSAQGCERGLARRTGSS